MMNVFGFEVSPICHGRDEVKNTSETIWAPSEDEEVCIPNSLDDLGIQWIVKRIDTNLVVMSAYRNLAIGKDYRYFYSAPVNGVEFLKAMMKDRRNNMSSTITEIYEVNTHSFRVYGPAPVEDQGLILKIKGTNYVQCRSGEGHTWFATRKAAWEFLVDVCLGNIKILEAELKRIRREVEVNE